MITKHRTGSLLKRGGNYYVRAMIEGKVIMRVLRDDTGNAISTRREAELAREKFMAPFALTSKVEALQSLAGALADGTAELARLDDQQHPALTIAQTWSEFLSSPNRPDSGKETLYQYECQWERFAGWMKEKYPALLTLREVSTAIAEEYAGSLNHGTLSANTYNKHLGLLTLVFRVVKRKAKIADNPWEDIQRKRLTTASRRELTLDELKRVCTTATGELRLLLALGVYSGLRLGDCATLRWCEVDLTRQTIYRIPNKIARSANPRTVNVPLHRDLAALLSDIPAASRGEYVLPETAALYLHRNDAVTDKVQAHFRACGIKVWKPGTGPESKGSKRAVIEVGFHSLRHTFVSICRASNVPLSVVESLVGHSNPAMTRHYTHVGELAASRAIAALPAINGETKPDATRDAAELLREALTIAKGITAKTWREKKSALLALMPELAA